ncbi:hypothetical protein BGZ75_001561 [Mortierella antarctica]|nr:hypothetical protein BGZ75_001561 [Mortierella antarctica]
MALKRNRKGLDSAPDTASTSSHSRSLKRRKVDLSPAPSPSTAQSESSATAESATDDQPTDAGSGDDNRSNATASDADEHDPIETTTIIEERWKRNRIANPTQMARHERDFKDWRWQMRLHYNGYLETEVKEMRESREPAKRAAGRKAQFDHGPDVEVWCERAIEDKGEGELEPGEVPPLSEVEWARWLSTQGRPLVGAGMCWTVEEGNRFFHGLRRFGKHNVWAIQAHIRSRSLAEVVAMIQVMELEVTRRRYFGLDTFDLSSMPMADEAENSLLRIEEACSDKLLWREDESKKASKRVRADVIPIVTDTARRARELFNGKAISHLQQLLRRRMRQQTKCEVQEDLFDALKGWLTAVIEELATLQHERHRVSNMLCKENPSKNLPRVTEMDVIRTLRARMLPLDFEPFFEGLAATYSGNIEPIKADIKKERKHRARYQRIREYDDLLEEKAVAVPYARFIEKYEPGYGILPKDASFVFDTTRAPPKTGFGLGQRDHGGLFFMDRLPDEQYTSSGYITVSDTEDEEEEERGWTHQMRADETLEFEHTRLCSNISSQL